MHVGDRATRNGRLIRGNGKPHRVEWLYQPEGRDETFVRGAVAHPDHATVYLEVWHRVVQNNEAEPAPEAQPFTADDVPRLILVIHRAATLSCRRPAIWCPWCTW